MTVATIKYVSDPSRVAAASTCIAGPFFCRSALSADASHHHLGGRRELHSRISSMRCASRPAALLTRLLHALTRPYYAQTAPSTMQD
ncbi:hypothetical protein LIA77_10089 [Sarocladium implicatum]|nr:hypothetical protein LIA77_10089 [Sarocladium implicatum]